MVEFRLSRVSLAAKLSALFILASAALAPATTAIAGDAEFFNSVKGRWTGPGEIVAGKYKGTRFNCDLQGESGGNGMDIGGTCRVGVFTQEMSASVIKSGKSYRGKFLDGAGGKGLDITGGRVSEQQITVSMSRQQLKGVMTAKLTSKDEMSVTIAVDVSGEKVPVIGMRLKRIDGQATASTGN
jgi:hypothetical protein